MSNSRLKHFIMNSIFALVVGSCNPWVAAPTSTRIPTLSAPTNTSITIATNTSTLAPTFTSTSLTTTVPGSTGLPTRASAHEVCGKTSESIKPQIIYEENVKYDDPVESLNVQILNYLNGVGSSNGLEDAIESATGAVPIITAQVIDADFAGGGKQDILTHINVQFPNSSDEILSLFTCTNKNYTLLDSLDNSVWSDIRDDPAAIVAAVDLNHNARQDIITRQPFIDGMKGSESLAIYEWNGNSLAPVFRFDPNHPQRFGQITVGDRDKDPSTLELTAQTRYIYEADTALSPVEYSFIRPIEMIYAWDGSGYALQCKYFTDDPTIRLTVLHSAETQLSCGFYDAAIGYYRKLLDDTNLDAEEIQQGILPLNFYVPSLLYPGSIDSFEKRAQYALDLERSYLRAFAGYRLIQLALNKQESKDAQSLLERLRQDYKPGDHGYIYTAMAITLSENYEKTGNLELACEAAKEKFHAIKANHEDPGLTYPPDEHVTYGFYFTSGRFYGSEPDNLFDVPDSIRSMIQIPFCLSTTP